MEEVARETVSSSANGDEMSCLPRYVFAFGTTSWLSVLHKFENLLSFDVLLGDYIEHRNGDETTVYSTADFLCTAVSSGYVMRSGRHYSEFKIIAGIPVIGIARPMPGLDAVRHEDDDGHDYGFYFIGDPDLYRKFVSERSDDWGDGDGVHACEYSCHEGKMSSTRWDEDYEYEELEGEEDKVEWEGMEGCTVGDIVGMLLDLDKGTLIVYKNNRRLGVMKDGLSGPYHWCAGVGVGSEVTIRRSTPPFLDDM